jgi:hypothetical protein
MSVPSLARSHIAPAPLVLALTILSLLAALGATLTEPLPQPAVSPMPPMVFSPRPGGAWESYGPRGALAFEAGGVALTMPAATGAAPTRLKVRFAAARGAAALAGDERLPGVINRYQGSDQAAWRVGVPTYAALSYRGLYPGIDLRYDGREGVLKGTFTVAPGADPSAIAWSYEGAEAVSIDQRSGDLLIALPGGGALAERAPIAWQEIGGRRAPVQVRFTLAGGLAGFALGSYDQALPLVIDPELVYGSYLGGSANDEAYGVALDGEGNIYLTGRTYSDDFPHTGGARATDRDIFITKLDPTGRQLLYSTIIGGRNGDDGIAVAVSAAGEAVVSAYTASDDFPLKAPLLDALAPSGGALIKLTPAGDLALSSYLNIDMYGAHRNIGLDQGGNIYLAGTLDGDVLVAKFGPDGELLAERQLGGRWADSGLALAVSSAGRTYITGETDGWDNDFPTTPDALQPLCAERMADPEATCNSEAFLLILEPTLELAYSSYLGGSYLDGGSAVALDAEGNIVVVGTTLSPDFPTRDAVQPVCPDGPSELGPESCGSFAAFVTKLSPDGGEIRFSTYFSSPDWSDDVVKDVAVDAAGNIHLLGWTNSTQYPVMNAPQPNLTLGVCSAGSERLCEDAVIAAFAPDGALVYSTYLGGSGKEYPYSLVADARGNVWVAGLTESRDFPATAGGLQPQKSLNGDIFLAKIGVGGGGTLPPPPPPPGDFRLHLPLLRG